MINKILIASLLMIPSMNADWVDDIMPLVDAGTLQQQSAVSLVENYIDTDESLIQRLEKMALEETESGVHAAIRASTYREQIAAARVSLAYYSRVLAYIQGLERNERERISFINHVLILKKHVHELAELKASNHKSIGLRNSAKKDSLIAAKVAQIETQRAHIKSSLVI